MACYAIAMKELFRQAKDHFAKRSSPLERPRETQIVDTIYGQYSVDIYRSLDYPSAPPLVVELGLGRRKESALAHAVVSKLVDPSRSTFVFQPVKQSRDIDLSAAGHIAAMNKMGIDEYDSVGLSFGGYETLVKAQKVGGRALHVVTFAAVGELAGGARAYARAAPGLLQSAKRESAGDLWSRAERTARNLGEHGVWLASCLGRPCNTLAQLALICQSDLVGAVGGLSPTTQLTMAVGGRDSVASRVGADSGVDLHRTRAGDAMAQRIVVRDVGHAITADPLTIGYITRASLHGEVLPGEMDACSLADQVRVQLCAPEPRTASPSLALAG